MGSPRPVQTVFSCGVVAFLASGLLPVWATVYGLSSSSADCVLLRCGGPPCIGLAACVGHSVWAFLVQCRLCSPAVWWPSLHRACCSCGPQGMGFLRPVQTVFSCWSSGPPCVGLAARVGHRAGALFVQCRLCSACVLREAMPASWLRGMAGAGGHGFVYTLWRMRRLALAPGLCRWALSCAGGSLLGPQAAGTPVPAHTVFSCSRRWPLLRRRVVAGATGGGHSCPGSHCVLLQQALASLAPAGRCWGNGGRVLTLLFTHERRLLASPRERLPRCPACPACHAYWAALET